MLNTPLRSFTVITAMFAFGVRPTLAQDAKEAGLAEEEQSAFSFALTPRGRYQFDTGLDGGNGDFRVFRGGVGAKADWKATDRMTLALGLGYEYSNYDFSRPNTFIAGATSPFEDIHILDLGLTAYVGIDEQWSWFAGVKGRVAGESGVDVDDAGTIGGVGGLVWDLGDDRSIAFGVSAMSQIEDDALILPIINVNWKLNEQWRFASSGSMGEIIAAIDDQNEIAFGAAWENRRFRLDDSAPQLAAVVEDTSVPIFLRFAHRPSESIAINLIGGVVLWQEFEVSNRNGLATRDFDADPSGFLGVNVSIGF